MLQLPVAGHCCVSKHSSVPPIGFVVVDSLEVPVVVVEIDGVVPVLASVVVVSGI
jgi:hypothetical protein